MRQKMKQLTGILLSLALVIGLVPGMGLTAYADGTEFNPASTYTGFDTLAGSDDTVTITEVSNIDWYVIGYDGANDTVTLLSKCEF